MEFPFFSNYWNNNPRHHWAGEETPAMNPHHWARGGVESPVVNRHQTVKNQGRRSPVVDIPVRFVGSVRSEAMKAAAAVKIQKVFRGLLVRKSMKKIDGIRKEVDEIEKRVSEKETILLLRRDDKERLKVNEMLMKLLLRLDSIRGVDSGIRVFRKSVIKKAIMLQEKVDEIVVSGDVDMVVVDTVQEKECDTDFLEPVAEVVDQKTLEIIDSENVVEVVEPVAEVVDQKTLEIIDSENVVVDQDMKLAAAEVVDPTVENVVDEDTKPALHSEAMLEAPADHTSELQQVSEIEDENLKEEEEDLMDIQQQSEGEKKAEEENGNGNGNRDLMERMIKGNEMLTGLVAELCERQESQTRLISSLSQRVLNLEKAFRCERSKRKKKRNNNNINKL